MELIWRFDRNYEVEVVEESIGAEAEPTIYVPTPSQRGAQDGITLKVAPRDLKPWIGRFAFGDPSGQSLTCVLSCPNADEMCVVSSGSGYIVKTNDWTKWQAVRAIPVCDVQAARDMRLLIFADFTKLVAYDEAGLKWQSPRVSSDGIERLEVSPRQATLIGWSAAEQQKRRVAIDLSSGTVVDDRPAH
jgi:hypothetical protein